jgi:serine-type D-Ala-D-Ala carboxypeptidase (penicillin-binding protein 5/6)
MTVEAFRAVPIEAKAVAVWDVSEGKLLFGKNASAQLPLASLTKVMLAYAANQTLKDESTVTVTGGDLSEEGSSGISGGERFHYADLRAATLVASLNDGANAISRTIGEQLRPGESVARQKSAAIDAMNASASALGLKQTYFYNEDGLDLSGGQPGAVGSAEDMAILFSGLLREYPETLLPTVAEGYELRSRFGNSYQYWNTNQRVKEIPGLLGSKTGYTALADGNLALAFAHDGRAFIAVILGSSKEGRFTDAEHIVRFVMSHPTPKLADARDMISP